MSDQLPPFEEVAEERRLADEVHTRLALAQAAIDAARAAGLYVTITNGFTNTGPLGAYVERRIPRRSIDYKPDGTTTLHIEPMPPQTESLTPCRPRSAIT